MSALIQSIIDAITSVFTDLGTAVINLIKTGFIELFCETDSTTNAITGLSVFAYVSFVLMGISLTLGLVYYLVNMTRRSR